MKWGLLGPEILPHERRVRTLGLGAAVRGFNEVAVPGMGGVWFGKQLLLPLLGISIAEAARSGGMQVSKIEMANAIEALACLSAYDATGWRSDPRIRGGQKLKGVSQPPFSKARKHNFYVSQPMRMSTVEPLLALGFVDGATERFNAMRLSQTGASFLESALAPFRPKNRNVRDHLLSWVRGDEPSVMTGKLTEAISPLTPLPADARNLLFKQVTTHGAGSPRRRAGLEWVESDERATTWDNRPSAISEDHWRDLRIGAKFFIARDAALDLLEAVEQQVALNGGKSLEAASLARTLTKLQNRLRVRAEAYLDETIADVSFHAAELFCKECANSNDVIASLARRDGRILRFRDGMILPGAAFDHTVRTTNEENADAESSRGPRWPLGISRRIDNLSWLSFDLKLELDKQIGGKSNDEN
jgi:hypothetical protein